MEKIDDIQKDPERGITITSDIRESNIKSNIQSIGINIDPNQREIIEEHIKLGHKVLVIGGSSVGPHTARMIHDHLGANVCLITPESGKLDGFIPQQIIREKLLFNAEESFEDSKYIDVKAVDNTPWYNQFDKKRNKHKR
jgi:hypothetical protein